MKWMQFFTPVKSLDFKETKEYIENNPGDKITILDVRQPVEYQDGHIPGAMLIPLPQLSDRLDELDNQRPTLVYCAIGGRSRVAAQMLAGKGFKEVFNVSGGIKAWQAKTAIGSQDLGMDVFSGREEPLDILKVAYSLELGLCEFYQSMEKEAENDKVKDLFSKLSQIEVKHQISIHKAYNKISPSEVSREELENMVGKKALEGGLTTREYLELFNPDLTSEIDVISLAMSIEAQALDLYHRVAANIEIPESKEIINKIADEEKAHLASLGKLMDDLSQGE